MAGSAKYPDAVSGEASDLSSTAAGKGPALVGHEGGTTVKAKLDALATVDAAAGTGSLRTIGVTATSACAGNDSRLFDRDAILRSAQGIISETCPRSHTVASTVMVSGSIYFCAVPLIAGDIVTNISVCFAAAGTLLTLSKVGLYSKAGALLASSADQGTAWQTAGFQAIAMAAPFTVITTDQYFVAAVCTFTGVGPSINRMSAGAGTPLLNTAIGAGGIPWGIQTGQTDLVTPATIVVGTVALAIWAAIS